PTARAADRVDRGQVGHGGLAGPNILGNHRSSSQVHSSARYRGGPGPCQGNSPAARRSWQPAPAAAAFRTRFVEKLVWTAGGPPDAWLAAWNRGGKVGPAADGRKARGQAPVTVNADTIREFRLLVDDLMGRVETLAKTSSAWYAEERTRSRRVALLKPYNLRF